MNEILSEDVLNNDSFLSCAVPTARCFPLLRELRDPYEKSIARNKLTQLRAKLTEIDKCKTGIASLLLKVATIKINPTLGTHIMAQSLLEKDCHLTLVAEKMVAFQHKLKDKVLLNGLRRRLVQKRDKQFSSLLLSTAFLIDV